MIGLLASTNHELILSINKSFPKGIFSVEDFIEKIHKGTTFYSVRLLPELELVSKKSFTLRSVNKNKGTCFLSENWKVAGLSGYSSDKKCWYFSSLLNIDCACFISESEAILYEKQLQSNMQKIIGVI